MAEQRPKPKRITTDHFGKGKDLENEHYVRPNDYGLLRGFACAFFFCSCFCCSLLCCFLLFLILCLQFLILCFLFAYAHFTFNFIFNKFEKWRNNVQNQNVP